MNVSKKSGIVLVLAGIALILSALSLFLYNWYENVQAGREAENLLADMRKVMSEEQAAAPTQPQTSTSSQPLAPELPVMQIEGYEYVGYLSIPDLELELPVLSEWDYTRLKMAPCRQFGSSRTDDLVIAAHNYKKHFGRLSQLEVGDIVVFTDIDGIENTYKVACADRLMPTEVDKVQNSEYDLVLYTCTYDGNTRVTIFCDRFEVPTETSGED